MLVVRKSTFVFKALCQNILTGVSKGRVTEVMHQRHRLNQILVNPQRSGNRAGDRTDLERVGETVTMIIACLIGKDLSFVTESPVRRRMKNAVAIPLERASIFLLGLRVLTALRMSAMYRIRLEQHAVQAHRVWA